MLDVDILCGQFLGLKFRKKAQNPPWVRCEKKKINYVKTYIKAYIIRRNSIQYIFCEQFLHWIDLQLHSVMSYQFWHAREVSVLVRLACLFQLP